jgi:hypothetical protein
MALISFLRGADKSAVSIGVISQLNINGNHALTDGSKADTVTTERLEKGDSVVVVTSDRGLKYIIAGAR